MVHVQSLCIRVALALALAGCASATGEGGAPGSNDGGALDRNAPPDSPSWSEGEGGNVPDGTTGRTGDSGSGGDIDAGGGGDGSGGMDAGTADAQDAPDVHVDAGVAADAGGGEGTLVAGVLAFPAPGSHGVCPDPPLRLTFSAPPSLGTSGKIQVFDASQAGTPVASVDMAATAFSDTIGGITFNTLRPAYVDGNDAVIYLRSHALTYGHTYYVTVDPGAIKPPTGTLAITDTTTWRFSTADAAPGNLTALTVSLEGAGEFCSVQGALDALPANNTAASQILVESGTYHEIVHLASKNNVTLLGQSRTATIIEGTNNNNLNPSTRTRSLFGVDSSSGLVIDTLTISNLTPQGGSQAEALRLQSCDECVVRNANISSLQDTLLWEGRIYADSCTISGNVDFVWGGGVAYFNKCQIHTTGQAGAIVQARNSPTTYGYVFVDSVLTADPSVSGQVLGRIDVSQYPGSHVAYISCTMGSFIAPGGWTITGGTPTSQLRFWEYQSVDSTGQAIDVSKRVAGSTQISATEAASMRDPTVVLSGWSLP
jgi:pectin methylesterase-like acyl-CoA thioesterase